VRFELIQAGSIDITPEEGVKDSRPTSSLLEHEGFRVVIDTEHPKEDGLQYGAAFARLGLSPADVRCVIFTHLHPDHFGHKNLFPAATFVFHKDERMGFYFKNDKRIVLHGSALLAPCPDALDRPEYIDANPDLGNLGDRIYVRHAPGHTPGSTMIFARIHQLIYAWVGDTFLNKTYFEQWQPPGSSWDQARIYEHMLYAREVADVIVPGHGPPFRTQPAGLECGDPSPP
jgi:glyoxylase-like metal-dependent hydrolase (beta-lactamase superfamily II)